MARGRAGPFSPLHSAPFAADHLLESLSVTNDGSRLVGGHTRAPWDAGRSAATRYSRIACAASVADSLSPMACVSNCDFDGAE